jgi:hypothetical protein
MTTTTALLIVFFMLAPAGLLLFYLNDNARFKRRYFPALVVLMGAVTVGISARDGLWWLAGVRRHPSVVQRELRHRGACRSRRLLVPSRIRVVLG